MTMKILMTFPFGASSLPQLGEELLLHYTTSSLYNFSQIYIIFSEFIKFLQTFPRKQIGNKIINFERPIGYSSVS